MIKKFLAKQLPLLVTIAGAITLSIESYLSLHDKSLCKTEACAVVSKYLTISESLLITSGALYFWILALVLFFAARYPKLKYFPLFLLAPALAFDSSLIGFQFFSIQQHCILCIFIATLLLLITTIFCFTRKYFVILICFILVWLGGFGVNSFITMPAPQGAYYNMAFFSTDGSTQNTKIFSPKMTLIISMNCPHCLDVINFLSENQPTNINFNLAAIDSDPASLTKLSFFLNQTSSSSNQFKLLADIKGNNSITDTSIKKDLRIQTKNSLSFLSNLGVTSIPVLVAEIEKNEKMILIGSDKIIPFLNETLDTDN